MLCCIITFIGFLLFAHYCKELVHTIYVLFFAKPVDLPKLYGKNSYVIITGGSKGIGLGLAKEFAKRNFNLVLIARNKDDLRNAKDELTSFNKGIDVITRSFDFNLLGEPGVEHNMWELLDLSQELDYSILVNNVGMANRDILLNTDEETIKRLITVNCTSQAVMSHMMTNYFNKRGKLSCIMTTSSLSTMFPFPAYELYGASKSFNRYLSLTLLDNPLIDSYTFCPAFVDTALSRSKANWFKVQSSESAKSAIKFLGRHRMEFFGHWKHELLYFVFKALPSFVVLLISQRKIKMKNQRPIPK